MSDTFQRHLSGFLLDYLPRIRGYSSNTVSSYRDVFVVLLRYLKEVRHIPIERISINELGKDAIEGFLLWLSEEKKLSASTCNHRLAVIKSFFRYVGYASPELIMQANSILSIEKKKAGQKYVEYLSLEAVGLILESAAIADIRQLAVLALLYDSGTRVQEVCDLTIKDFHSSRPYTVKVIGKGMKARIIPLTPQSAKILSAYLKECRSESKCDDPMFLNRDGKALGRAGVAYILNSNVKAAHYVNPEKVPCSATPHMLRHSKAVHLLEAGVNLVYIRDFLGHSSVSTTEVYARVSPELKRAALEKAGSKVIKKSRYKAKEKKDLLAWLKETI